MSGRRPTGRFFILLMLIAGVVLFAIMNLFRPGEARYDIVRSGTSSDTRRVQAVIMRNENVASMESGGTISYVAQEGALVSAGDEIAYIYSAGYSASQLQALEKVRSEIRAYHLSILGTIIDTRLDRLESNVQYLAVQLKSLVNRRSSGNLLNLETQLTEAMEARQTYLSQNQREDVKLTTLYETESKREAQISSWRSVETAASDGVVSFYLDGYETFLSIDNTANITVDALRSVLQGKTVNTDASRLTTSIYRLVDMGRWYVYILTDDGSFNPVTNQRFWFQMEGFEDVVYDASVVSSVKSGSTVMTLLQIDDPMGPLLNQRCGSATVSTEMSGLKVPRGAIYRENGQTGVYVYDGAGGTFIPVIVLSSDADGVLISTEYESALYVGCNVKVR
ncbi:MAG: hypothetical protein IJ048_12515 [Clostridia bacterium]|nr:hypothetical protein [Clostridia bacterium]